MVVIIWPKNEWNGKTCLMFFDDHLVGCALLVYKHKQLEEDKAEFPD